MKLTLIAYERDLFEYVNKELGVERRLLIGFAISLDCLRRLFQDLLTDTPDELRAGRVVLIGLLNHTHHLLVGGLQSLRDGNGTVWSLCVRSLMETFGACVLISERPQTAPNYLTLRNPAGPLRKAAERAQPGLEKDIRRLDEMVHPGSRAILAGIHVVDAGQRRVDIRYGLRPSAPDDAQEAVTVLANLATLIGDKLEELSRNPVVVDAGNVIGINRADNQEASS